MSDAPIFTFPSKLEPSGHRLWSFHFPVQPEVSAHFKAQGNLRVWCSINGTEAFQCALTAAGKGKYVITVNKSRQKQHALTEGSSAELMLQEDNSRYGLPFPEELEAVLADDAEGHRLLHELSPGKLRTLLYLAAQGKDSDERIRRAVCIIEHLKRFNGKINYKLLHAEL